MQHDYDLIAIGGGSAGITLGEFGAKLGARVAIVEAAKLGGDCTWHGCVPSKALLAAARVAHTMRHADRYGLPAAAPEVDLAQVLARVREVQEGIYQSKDSPEHLRAQGCAVIEGRGTFIAPDLLEVGGQQLRARRFCIATGSRAAVPPIPGLAEGPFLTNETLFHLETVPARLLVVGGGPIGVELGQAMARFGSQVTIVEAEGQLLPKEDAELAELLQRCLEGEGMTIWSGASVQAVAWQGAGGVATVRRQGKEQPLAFDALLVAAGRAPNVGGLGLEAAGVEYDERGGIRVDERLRTSNPHIYACGDVIGRYPFTHTAAYEAALVLVNALFAPLGKVDYRPHPWATFSDPAVARAGLSEVEARQAHRRVRVYRYPFHLDDRATTERQREGLVKLICAGFQERIVGAHIVGPHADELIHEFIVAIQQGMSAYSVASLIHIYPTRSQALRYAAQQPLDGWLAHRWPQRALRGALALARRLPQ